MKTEGRLLMAKTKVFLTAAFLLCGVLSLSGCITSKVIELRQARESRVKEAANFWSLDAARSGYVAAGGEVVACVEFRDSPANAPQPYTINLSQASQIGKIFGDFAPADDARAEPDHGSPAPSGPVWYLYPLQEAQKGCGNSAGESAFPVSELKIDSLKIRREDLPHLPEILHPQNAGAVDQGRLIEIGFEPEGSQPMSSGGKDVLLVYLPPDEGSENVQPIGIAGAFEPGSEWVNPYTLLVGPAVAVDTAIVTSVVLFCISAPKICRW